MANRRRTPIVAKKETEKPKSKKKKISKKKSAPKSSNKSSKSGKGDGFTSVVRFFKDEKTQAILGVFLLLFTVFLLFSFVSFFGTREADDSIFSPNFFDTINTNDTPKNKFGIIGLYFSFLFIKHWFGVASLGLLLLGFIYGVKLLFKKSLLPILRTTIVVLAVMIWFSMLFAFIVSSQSWVGGGIGDIFQQYFVGKFGKGGFIIFMIFLAFVLLIAFGGVSFYKYFTKKEKGEKDEDVINQENNVFEDDFHSEESVSTPKEKKPSVFSKIFAWRKKKKKEENLFSEDDNNLGYSLIGDDNIATKDDMIFPTESELKAVEEIPGEDFLIDESEETGIETNEFEIIEKSSLSDEEFEMDDELIQEEGEGAEYEKLPPYDPKEDLPHFRFPDVELLENYSNVLRTREQKEMEIAKNKVRIKETLEHYNIIIQSISAIEGPTITLYEIVPAPGIRISRIKGLEDDIALSLAALGIRIIAPMPGKGTIGIEVPNAVAQIVPMKSVILSEKFQNTENMALPIAIGKTISNDVFVFDLAKMPHVLMAGATGQGKSVGLNAILTSLLYKKHPAELKFVLVDPKKVELTLYSKIERHYLAKLPDVEDAIITDTKKVVRTLNSLCVEMDTRYELLNTAQCRNIIEYNTKFKERRLNPEKGHRFLPYIVLVFDEFADCIMTAGREVETPIARLAQLARAIGIHLIIATQRPSVNVITGLIKANFPARIAFRVSSKIDSRTILDAGGADSLIGKGDMLVSTGNAVTRVQCALVDTPEIERICDFIGEQHGYTDALLLPEVIDESSDAIQEVDDGEFDACFADAAREVVSKQQGSTSFLQRRFKLGYNRAGRIMDQLEREKIVGPSIGSKTREVLIKDMNTLEEFLQNNNLA
jgi:S-DNA-T family DNA segregation ATPase FtsK/SpoIIIE